MTSPLPSPQTSVCRSMISCPTRGMVVFVFSHSTECRSRGEAARGSRSLRTHAGGDCGIPRTPSHGLSKGACCLSCENTTKRHFRNVVAHQVQVIPDIIIVRWWKRALTKSNVPVAVPVETLLLHEASGITYDGVSRLYNKFWECEVVYKHSHCGLFCHFLLKTHSISQTVRRKKIHPYSNGLKVMLTITQYTNYWWFYLFIHFYLDQIFVTLCLCCGFCFFSLSRMNFFSPCISFMAKTGLSLVLPCCRKLVTLCPSQHDAVSCSDPVAYSDGASWCALFSGEENTKTRFNLEIYDRCEVMPSTEFSAKHLPQNPIQHIVISVSARIEEMGRTFRVQCKISAAECIHQD